MNYRGSFTLGFRKNVKDTGYIEMGKMMTEDDLSGIYKDFAENYGIDMARKIYESYKGLQVTFPVKFYSADYVKRQVMKEYNGSNVKELARKYECSERKIRSIIKESR